ncbi:MAG: hypothetical protein ACE5GC_02485, partial [Acidimicrobiia bacterium]
GVISGFSKWSSIGGGVSIAAALLVPQVLGLGLLAGIPVIIGVVTVGFLAVLWFVGRPMARRHDPALSTPYITLALTNRRVLLIERGTGREASVVIEETARRQVTNVAYSKGGWLTPHRLGYRVGKADRRFEFPRVEQVGRLAEGLRG